LEAKLDGFAVTRLTAASIYGEVFVTSTGQTGVIRREHLKMKEGTILANAGHFDVEIDLGYIHAAGGDGVVVCQPAFVDIAHHEKS
jgi:adenosylhomocysteinase